MDEGGGFFALAIIYTRGLKKNTPMKIMVIHDVFLSYDSMKGIMSIVRNLPVLMPHAQSPIPPLLAWGCLHYPCSMPEKSSFRPLDKGMTAPPQHWVELVRSLHSWSHFNMSILFIRRRSSPIWMEQMICSAIMLMNRAPWSLTWKDCYCLALCRDFNFWNDENWLQLVNRLHYGTLPEKHQALCIRSRAGKAPYELYGLSWIANRFVIYLVSPSSIC